MILYKGLPESRKVNLFDHSYFANPRFVFDKLSTLCIFVLFDFLQGLLQGSVKQTSVMCVTGQYVGVIAVNQFVVF